MFDEDGDFLDLSDSLNKNIQITGNQVPIKKDNYELRSDNKNVRDNTRDSSQLFTPSGRYIPSAMKRQGQSPPTPRKRVSFSIPYVDFAPESHEDESPEDNTELVPLVPIHQDRVVQTVKFSDGLPNIATKNGVESFGGPLPKPPMETNQSNFGILDPRPAATFRSLRTKLRGMAPVRERPFLPASDPLKICFHCRGSLISHSELKKAVDSSIHYFKDARVTCLQFDPLATWSGDPSAMSRWVISLSDSDACHYLARTGLNLNGHHHIVTSYDDIVMEEFEVFKMKREILQAPRQKATPT